MTRLSLKDIHPSVGIDSSSFANDLFAVYCLKSGYYVFRNERWETDLEDLPAEDAIYIDRGRLAKEVIYAYDNCVVRAVIRPDSGDLFIYTASSREEECDKAVEMWKERAPAANRSDDDHKVTIDFWTLANNGPQSVRRKIDVPDWETIQENYHSSTHAQLSKLFVPTFTPSHGGQLLLWHGEPGTGKTFALRALAYQWRKWCKFEYIVDPETFFGSQASYLIKVLMGEDSTHHPRWYDDDDDDVPEKPIKNGWRCLIFEDTGELLSEDAGRRAGQGLSRLLNVVDGLIGQGLKVMILITTNEDMASLHRAVSRPGRAAENVMFSELSPEESVLWAKHHNLSLPNLNKQYTIAELFGLLEGHNLTGSKVPTAAGNKAIGFRPLALVAKS